MQTVYTLTEAVALAIKVETQLDRSKVAVGARSFMDNNRAAVNKGKAPMTQPAFANAVGNNGTPTKPVNIAPPEVTPCNPYARPGPDKCYRCGQPRHRSNQCPRRGVVNLVETEEDCRRVTEKDENEAVYAYEEEEEITGGDEGELLSHSLVVQ